MGRRGAGLPALAGAIFAAESLRGVSVRPARGLLGAVAVSLLAVSLLAVSLARPAGAAPGRAAGPSAICRSSSHGALAVRISRGIQAARRGRVSAVAVAVDDPGIGLACRLNGSRHFDSASVVKVTILAALLRQAHDQHRYLTRTEAARARAMITRSDNAAASALWAEVGRRRLQHFLNLARMTHTVLGPDGAWGLTEITAADEALLLRLLLTQNPVLSTPARDYALGLMAHVIPGQRWGVPAGAPARLTVHVKNGWLPLAAHGWRIHSIGGFTGRGGGYSIVVLTQDNPTMAGGIATIEAIAEVINRDLNPRELAGRVTARRSGTVISAHVTSEAHSGPVPKSSGHGASLAGMAPAYSGGASVCESAATIVTSARLMARSAGSAASLSRTAAAARASGPAGAPAWWPTTRCRSLSTSPGPAW